MNDPTAAAAPGTPRGSSTGLDPSLASALAYLAWWVTGLLFLAIERRDETVRFHAAQAVVVFGAFTLVMATTYGAALALLLAGSPTPAARLFFVATNLTWRAAAVLWAWLLWSAIRGERWRVPGLGWLVERLAAGR
jgi:uncharacterized membrane protein